MWKGSELSLQLMDRRNALAPIEACALCGLEKAVVALEANSRNGAFMEWPVPVDRN